MKKALFITIMLLFLTACGRKGALMPPEALVPAAIQDLNVLQSGGKTAA
jgi:predicted small lipoprotein YifL